MGGVARDGRLAPREVRWDLNAREGAALEKLLDDPATLTQTHERPPMGAADDLCPDVPLTYMEIRWRGRTGRVHQTCGFFEPIAQVQALLKAGRD